MRRFLRLPWRIYAGDPNWVPPLLVGLKDKLDARRHPFFEHAEAASFLACRDGDGEPVGRITAIVDRAHNEAHQDRTGFFGLFECLDDPEAARALVDAAAAWCAERGRDTLRGPMNLSMNDECAMLLEGFDGPPVVMMPYNPRYYLDLMAGCGLAKAKDLYAFRVDAAGAGWDALVDWSLAQGCAGLENLALIPGLVGAAPIQNIGAYGMELAERFDSLLAWDCETRQTVRMPAVECDFGYRDSVFKRQLVGRRIVLSITLALPTRWQPAAAYADVAHELKNPLTSLRSAVETLPLARSDESRGRLLAVIQHDVKRLDRLISDISDASRLDAELQRQESAPVNLHTLLTAVVSIANEVPVLRMNTIPEHRSQHFFRRVSEHGGQSVVHIH
jgi:hypothetical protein